MRRIVIGLGDVNWRTRRYPSPEVVMDVLLFVLATVLVFIVVGLSASVRVVKQIERGVVFRLGRAQPEVRRPGPTMLIPFADRMTRVNMQVVTMPVPAQDGITHDNVTVRVDAVVYFRVMDPVRAVVEVQDYQYAISQVARPRCDRSSARASSTTCCPTASASIRASR